MDSEQITSNLPPDQALPPVQPPSSRHLVQMFVVPGLIVGGVVLLGLTCSGAFSYMLGLDTSKTPASFIKRLEDPNTDIRWRAASDLVQVLKRDDDLASDPDLALKLGELLTQELEGIAFDEKALAERRGSLSDKDQAQEAARIKTRADYARFLSSCLASLMLPVGVDPLKQMAATKGSDPKAVAQMRRHAVWMLANLGENLRRFEGDPAKGYAGLPADKRAAIVARLEQEANGSGPRRQLASRTLEYLNRKQDLGVIGALADTAKADDPDLRKYTAFALTFWDGSAQENKLAEQVLLNLSRDDGRGVRIILEETD